MRKALLFVVLAAVALSAVGFAHAAVGDEISNVTFPEGALTGVGVAFDGEFLYYSYIDYKDLYKIRPDGSGHDTINVTGVTEDGLGALAYDAGRGMIWAGTYGCDSNEDAPIYLIDPATGVATYMFSIPGAYVTYCLDDGLAYDSTDDSLYYSDDVSSTIVHVMSNGTLIETINGPSIDTRLAYNSGIAIGGDNLYLGTDGQEVTLRVNKNTLSLIDEFVNTDYRIEDMECDPNTFAPTEVMWIRDAYAGDTRAYEIEAGTCGLGGQPPQPPAIPEFGVVAGGLALIGALGLYLYKRRH